jgi:NADH dehydrogenase FAD-containing subunit
MNAIPMPAFLESYDVAVMGAGYAGLIAALRLARSRGRLRVVLIGATDQFVERVRPQESIVREVAPRIPSIGSFLASSPIDFICGRIVSLDAMGRRLRIATGERERKISFDQAIYALGSSIDVEAISGAAEHAYRLEMGDGPRSATALRLRLEASKDRAERVVIVGGAETGVEVAAEIKTAWPKAEVTMVSRSRCGAFKGPRVEKVVRAELMRLGVRLLDGESIAEVHRTEVVTGRGQLIPHDVCVWSGGLRSADLAQRAGVAVDRQNRVLVDGNLRSVSHLHILAVGDAAHPVAPTGAPYRLSAFVALASGAYTRPFSFSTLGQGIAIGRRGVGLFTFPNDAPRYFIIRGKVARSLRNVFVWFVVVILRLERRWPGFFFWPGRRRVSWQEATIAMKELKQVPQSQAT